MNPTPIQPLLCVQCGRSCATGATSTNFVIILGPPGKPDPVFCGKRCSDEWRTTSASTGDDNE